MQTITAPAPANDCVYDYDVSVTSDDDRFNSVVPVRLTFAESEDVGHLSDRAMAEASRRAIRIAKRDFPALTDGIKHLHTGVPEPVRVRLVREGVRPRGR